MKKNRKLWNRIMSMVLVTAILFGMMPYTAFAAAISETANTVVADAPTLDGWKAYFTDGSTRYAGGVYVDKTVFSAADALNYFKNDIADRLSFGKDHFGNDNFLIALSGIASNTQIVGYSSAPTDTMLVLDLSASMRNSDSVDEMVKGTNIAIDMLLRLNKNNRVGVVLYSGNSSQNSNATTGTAVTVLPLGRYTTTETVTETYTEVDEAGVTQTLTRTYSAYFKNQVTNSNGSTTMTVKVGDNVVKEGTTTKVSGSKVVNGGTYMQNGIFFAYNAFKDATDKVIPEGQMQAGTKRTPIMVFMGDGAPTIGTTSYNNVGTSNHGDGTVSSARLSFLTQLTAAWTKAKVAGLYETDMQLYTLGIGTSNNQHATDVLNPMNTNSTTASMWTKFINNQANYRGYVTVDGSGNNAFSVPKDSETFTSVDQREYVDSYTTANTVTEISKAFESIANAIVKKSQMLQDKYYATLVNTDANSDGYISFSDEIGYGMEVKNVKGIHIGKGTLVTGDMFAEYMTTGRIIDSTGNLTEIGTELMSALQSRFGIDATQARQLIATSIANGDIAYENSANFSNFVSWYAKADNSYLAPYSKGSRNAAPEGAAYLMKSYIYLGDVTQNEVETSMMYVLIRVKEDIATGYQVVEANLPASLLPMVTYSIEIRGEEMTEENIISMTNNADEKSPATLLYEVGIKDSLNPYNITEELDPRKANADGTYTFYTNRWMGDDGLPFTIPEEAPEGLFHHGLLDTTVAHFIPSTENIRYYYTEDTAIYTRNGSVYTLYTQAQAPSGTEYYHKFEFIEKDGETLRYRTVYNHISENALQNAKRVDGAWYIAKGTPKNFFSFDGNIAGGSLADIEKTENKTGTLSWSLYPQVNYNSSLGEEGYHIVGYLGNNGKVTVAAAQGIKISKTVPETVEGAEDAFNFTVTLSGEQIADSYATRLVKADGTIVEGTVQVRANANAT